MEHQSHHFNFSISGSPAKTPTAIVVISSFHICLTHFLSLHILDAEHYHLHFPLTTHHTLDTLDEKCHFSTQTPAQNTDTSAHALLSTLKNADNI
jgi:hypothetical protein